MQKLSIIQQWLIIATATECDVDPLACCWAALDGVPLNILVKLSTWAQGRMGGTRIGVSRGGEVEGWRGGGPPAVGVGGVTAHGSELGIGACGAGRWVRADADRSWCRGAGTWIGAGGRRNRAPTQRALGEDRPRQSAGA